MALKVDIIAPQIQPDSSAVTLVRWLKNIGDKVMQNEPIAELLGTQMRAYAHAPATGSLSSTMVMAGQNVLTGTVLGQLAVIDKNVMDWDNFDQVTVILEEFAEKSKNFNELKDANDALGQLLGIDDKPVFQNMDIEQRNQFLQNVVDQHKQLGLSPADVAQKLLEGLALRMPKNAPTAPRGPALGFAPAGPGMSPGMPANFGVVPQPHAYPSYPVGGGNPSAYMDASHWLPPVPPAHGYPTGMPVGGFPPQQIPPNVPPQPQTFESIPHVKDVEEEKKD